MIKPIMKTDKGYTVSGCNRAHQPRLGTWEGVVGRLRVVTEDPSQDKMLEWDKNFNPVGHDYGRLVRLKGIVNEEANGFNLFSGLRWL